MGVAACSCLFEINTDDVGMDQDVYGINLGVPAKNSLPRIQQPCISYSVNNNETVQMPPKKSRLAEADQLPTTRSHRKISFCASSPEPASGQILQFMQSLRVPQICIGPPERFRLVNASQLSATIRDKNISFRGAITDSDPGPILQFMQSLRVPPHPSW
jgi:hypothetical protein